MSSSIGTLFKVTTFGESHGVALGCVVDGLPAGLFLSQQMVQQFLNRRRPGQNEFTSSRAEKDVCEIVSGTENNISLGSPVCILVRNQDQKPQDYASVQGLFRPSHADYTTMMKYGISSSGGGRASARETVGRVAAAAVAKCFVSSVFPHIEVLAWVSRVGAFEAQICENTITFEDIEKSSVCCPDLKMEAEIKKELLDAKKQGDTLGGALRCVIRNVPAGLGEPVFDKLEADLAKAMMGIPSVKYFESGYGISSSYLKGSENNDVFYKDAQEKVRTRTNRSGGIQGGISNGMPITMSVGFKPVSSLFLEQNTVDKNGEEITFKPQAGRHDSCVLPRAVPVVEAMAWITIADHLMRFSI